MAGLKSVLKNYKEALISSNRVRLISFIVVFGVIGILTLLLTSAASPNSASEAESGSVAGGAQKITGDSTASGSAYVQFSSSNSSLPFIRGTFYYPWFPTTWNSPNGDPQLYPFSNFTPTLGLYSSTDPVVINKHIDEMIYAGMNSAIYSWWGQGVESDNRFPAFLSATGTKPLKWAIYHECEGNPAGGNNTCGAIGGPSPTISGIQSDLSYIRTKYASDPHYLIFNNKPVVFVYGDGTDSCTTASNWVTANNNLGAPFYLVLKVFGGFATCASQPDNWHQYGPSTAVHQHAGAIVISPGYWKKGCPQVSGGTCIQGGTQPYLARDLARWQTNVNALRDSTLPIRLVTTFNEWGEGSIIESATQWASASGHGSYIDVLHNTLVGTTPPPVDTQPPTAPTNVSATATSQTQVNLTWTASTDNVGVTNYEITRNGNVLKTVGNVTSDSDTTVSANTSYTYTIVAKDAAGNRSAASASASVTTPPTACSPNTASPSNFTVALSGGTKTVNLVWAAPTPGAGQCAITGYVVTRNGQVIASPTTTNYQDSTTNYNTTYTYLLQARDSIGTLVPTAGLASSPATITTPQITDTQAPDVPTANATVTSTTSVNITWGAVSDNPKTGGNAGLAGYKVYRNGTLIATTPANATSYGDQFNFVQGTAYSYRVSAFDAATTPNESAQSAASSVTPNPTAGASYIVVGAGDIGATAPAAQGTGNLIGALNPAANAVLTFGDNAYDSGTPTQFTNNYHPYWGPYKAKTYPSPGNHDYQTSGASGYYSYFGATSTSISGIQVSGTPNQGYYAFNIGASWRFYSLNTETNQSASNTFLANDLAANPKLCTVAYYHKPPFSSSATHPTDGYFTRSSFMQSLFNARGDLIIGGHQHHYERFARMTPSNTIDNTNGIRSWVVGTGGAGLYSFGSAQTGSEVRESTTRGILILTINDNGSYHWEYRSTGTYRDSGDGTCRP